VRHWYKSSSTSSIKGHENYSCCGAGLLLPKRYESQKITKSIQPTKHEPLVLSILLNQTEKTVRNQYETQQFHDQSQKIEQNRSRKSVKINFDKNWKKSLMSTNEQSYDKGTNYKHWWSKMEINKQPLSI